MSENLESTFSRDVVRLFAPTIERESPASEVESSVAGEVDDVMDDRARVGKVVFADCDLKLVDVMFSTDLRFIMKFVDELVGEIGCRDAAFFKHEAAIAEFRNSFLEFATLLSEELEDVSEIIRRSKEYTNFSENWKSLIRRASYYAFVVHFGAKRRGETDSDGNVQDYVRHVMRTGFNNVIRKARIMDERELAVSILHDTREDWHKGFAWLLQLDESSLDAMYCPEKCDSGVSIPGDIKKSQKRLQSKKGHIVLEKMTEMEGHLDDMLGERRVTDLSISELVCLLTKASGEKDRNRTILNMLNGILSYNNPAQREDAVVVLLLKICDRLDNLKSLMSSGGKTDTGMTKLDQIKDETILFFLAFAKEMGMQNVVEWLKDYLNVEDNQLRRSWTDMRRRADKIAPDGDRELSRDERLRPEFMREFHELLCEELGFSVDDLVEGHDYILEFRPIGMRHSDFDEARALAERGDYSKDFRHYITFYPVHEHSKILDAGIEAFKRLFPDPLDAAILERGELKCAFGQSLLAERKKVIPIGDHGHSDKYGHGVYSFFKSQKDAVAMLLGKWHMSRSYGCKESRRDVLGVMSSIEGEVAHLLRQYAILDRWELGIEELDSSVEVREKFRQGIFGIFGEIFGIHTRSVRNMENGLYKSGAENRKDRSSSLRNVLGKLVMMTPMRKRSTKVVVNGVPLVRSIPAGLRGMEILPWVDVKLLGLPISSIHHFDDKVLIEVSMFGFNQDLFDKQTGEKLCSEFRNIAEVARLWKGELLSDELDGEVTI